MKYKFCPLCSTKLESRMIGGRIRQTCLNCGFIHFLNPTTGVAVILLDETGRLLLGQRKDGGWCIPCGHIEWDESVEEAAHREFHEETGLEVELKSVFAVHSNFHDSRMHTVGIWFHGQQTGGKLKAGDDLFEIGWFGLDNLPNIKFPSDMLVIEKLKTR